MATRCAPVRSSGVEEVVNPFVEIQIDRRAVHEFDVGIVAATRRTRAGSVRAGPGSPGTSR